MVKGTGFHEPLSEDRNTTLPHPDADTSPNATMEAPEITPVRSHRSFLSIHHSSNSTYQKHHGCAFHPKEIEKSGMYDNTQSANGSREEKSLKELQEEHGSGFGSGTSKGS
ncbi:uncharacterized protein RAG0_16695 [Rhynchosporium agropyri]|uniref:Uncharacterized protein n=1 Tax=Rhynchosporium agropyri TaxID=914238 RepID=A0A1E1LRJ7_9HELO|nr:uncharacterized protein RAG0_16695 [Rhynchosporium agropyri]